MKNLSILAALTLTCLLASAGAFAQGNNPSSGFEAYRKQMEADFSQYVQEQQTDFKNYRDSLNREFARYLEEAWKDFDLMRQERGFEPMPAPPVYTPAPDEKPQPLPVTPAPLLVTPAPLPVTPQPAPVTPQPAPPQKPQPLPVTPAPRPEKPMLTADFFGASVRLQKLNLSVKRLSGVTEKSVADFWRSLSDIPAERISEDILRLQKEMQLNDWGVYQLVRRLFDAYLPNRTENERVIFSIFMLNQLGYRARIGRANSELVPLLAIQNRLLNTSCFTFNIDGRRVLYYVVNQSRKDLTSVQTCGREYSDKGRLMDLAVTRTPRLSDRTDVRTLQFQGREWHFSYSRSLPVFLETYPCVDFSVYADAPIDNVMLASLKDNFRPLLQDMSQEEAINFLLHFVQLAFHYKEDDKQFGYEKWNFAEETLISAYSDCDDRAIFFAQAVKNLLGMKVALVDYPGYHLATAVKFDNPHTDGDHVMVNGVKYLICDPTFIEANLGRAMPKLKNIPVEIFPVKQN